jgi:hypothetical protein
MRYALFILQSIPKTGPDMRVCLSFNERWYEGDKVSQQIDGVISSKGVAKILEIAVIAPHEDREKIIKDLPLSLSKGIIRIVDTSDLRLTNKWLTGR